VLPLAQRELDLLDIADRPGAHGILGASMGGLMALYAGLRVPHLFGRVLSQSGAFTLDGHDTVVWELVRHAPVRPLRIWMDVGRYEWLLDCNRRLHELLVDRGYPVNYRELNAGHNYPAWRDDLSHGLEHLFGV
jgi:enterochelin esterase family protein